MSRAADLLNSLGIAGPNIRHELQTEPEIKALHDATWNEQWCVCGRLWPCEAAELAELVLHTEALFDLQWTRTRAADKLWQRHNPGNDNVWPDLGKLIGWLMDEWPALAAVENVRRVTDEMAAAAHDAWYAEKAARLAAAGLPHSWPSETGEEQLVPWAELSEPVREFDRIVIGAALAESRKRSNGMIIVDPEVQPVVGTCKLPPDGWFCTLAAGHDGPCPTWPA